MSDIHALSGAYAVDAVDDVERARFERHLADCDACRQEVAELREAAALLADEVATPAPDSLRASVLSGIARVRPLPPETLERADQPFKKIPVHRRAAYCPGPPSAIS